MATLWVRIPLDVRVEDADLVVVGRIVNEAPGPVVAQRYNVFMFSHTTFGFEGPPQVTFGTLQVDEVLKGRPDSGLIRLAYGDHQNSRELGDEGIWLLRWDPKYQAYRCDYPWDRQDHAARAKVETYIQQAQTRQYFGPVGGLQLYATPRQNRIGPDDDCAIAVGIYNSGSATVLDRKSYLEVIVDKRIVKTIRLSDWQPELLLEASSRKRDFLGTNGEVKVPSESFSTPGKHSLRLELFHEGKSVVSDTIEVERITEALPKNDERRSWPEDPPVPLWPVSTDHEVRYSPDGSRLLTGDPHGVAAWDLATHLPVYRLNEKMGFNQRGELLKSDGIYDCTTGKKIGDLKGPVFEAIRGNFGIVADIARPIEIWKVNPLARLHSIAIEGYAHTMSPDGTTVAILSDDQRLHLVASETGQVVKTLTNVTSFDSDPQGQLLCGFDDGTVQIGDGPKWSIGKNRVRGIRCDRQGQRFATVCGNEVVVWQMDGRQPVVRLKPGNDLQRVDFSPPGSELAVMVNSEAQIYSIPKGKLLHHFWACTPGDSLAWNNSSTQLAVAGANAVAKWDLNEGKLVWWTPAIQAQSVLFTPEDELAWLNLEELHWADSVIPLRAKKLHLDGNSLVADRHWLRQGNLEPLDSKVPLEAAERVISLSQDFVLAATKKSLRVLDRQLGQIGRFDHTSERGQSEIAAISPDQRWLARLNDKHYLEILEVPSLRLKFSLGKQYFVRDLAWRADSAQLAVTANDAVYLWNIQTGLLQKALPCRLPSGVAYSPDGRYLAEGLSTDASVCLWNLKTFEKIAVLASYGKEWVVLAPDGRFDASDNATPYLRNVDLKKRTPGLLPTILAK